MTKRYGILAYPAGHSLSPAMHNAAFKALEIDAEYGVFEISPEKLASFMDRAENEPISGLSVSLPHKEAVIPFLNVVDDAAKKIGAVNTVVHKGSFFHGYNTDHIGARRALKKVCGELKDKKVVVLGAGGTARAIVFGLKEAGCEVSVYNRNTEKALALAGDFGVEGGSLYDAHQISGADILIQTTSIWTLNPEISQEDIDEFIPDSFVKNFDVVMDTVYSPLKTPLLKKAEILGKKVITGDKMLLHQAVEQFKIWTEKDAPEEIMNEVLEANL